MTPGIKGIRGADAHEKGLARFINSSCIYLLLTLSVVINILLAHHVSNLRSLNDELKAEGTLRVGTEVLSIEGRSLEGSKELFDYRDSPVPTVLYVFIPQCSWCRKNLDNLHALIDNSGSRYRVLGISLTRTDLKEYLTKEHLSFPVYTDLPDSTRAAYHLGGTPTTIVISPQGKVLRVWYGAYRDGIRQEIEGYLHIHLPSCCIEDSVSSVTASR